MARRYRAFAGVANGGLGYARCVSDQEVDRTPPRGVKKGTKRARQYEQIKESQLEQGRSGDRAEEIAARTVNKERARAGESRTRSRVSKGQLQRAVDAKKR